MTTRQTLLNLAARVEGLDGPCREVDAYVAASRIKDLRKLAVLNTPEKWVKASIADRWNIPAYTASIDAAMTLVPEGCDWSVGSEQGRGVAYIIDRADSLSHFYPDATAVSPAAALTAAALRARAAMMESE